MKFGVMNKSTILNKFLLHTLQRNITHLAVITRKSNIKLGILKGGGGDWKRAEISRLHQIFAKSILVSFTKKFMLPILKKPRLFFIIQITLNIVQLS